jgi:hypothetical protein
MGGVFWFVLASLACWRVTHLLVAEDGPFEAVARLRQAAARFTRVFDCFYCMSLWVAAPLSLLMGDSWLRTALLWLAISAVSIFVERVIAALEPARPAEWKEDEE